jgi:hypothetical protein
MKDVATKNVAGTALQAVSNLQMMTTYDTKVKSTRNPRCDTILINYDECVQEPRKAGDGEKFRSAPNWTVLIPPGATRPGISVLLKSIGESLLNEEEKSSSTKGKNKKRGDVKQRKSDVVVTSCIETYLTSIYGDEGDVELSKKKRYLKKQNSQK